MVDGYMNEQNEKVIKKGFFKKVAYSSAKKYACQTGELILTPKHLIINCKGNWSRTLRYREFGLKTHDGNLEIFDSWRGRVLFIFIIDNAKEWENVFRKVQHKHLEKEVISYWEAERKRPEELKKLFDISPEASKKIYADIRKDRTQFMKKNIKFNLEIYISVKASKNRKLKAFILAHSYATWFEWIKRFLYKIYKAKFGKGPENDGELIKYLDNYPSLGFLDTKELEIEANQIRNCIAHEKFYYEYKPNEFVFILNNKEKRVRLPEIEWRFRAIQRTYVTLIQCLEEKAEKGEISYRSVM